MCKSNIGRRGQNSERKSEKLQQVTLNSVRNVLTNELIAESCQDVWFVTSLLDAQQYPAAEIVARRFRGISGISGDTDFGGHHTQFGATRVCSRRRTHIGERKAIPLLVSFACPVR